MSCSSTATAKGLTTSRPGKMPGGAWGISAKDCIKGSQLRPLPQSTCHHCYALKHRYQCPNVQNAYDARLAAYKANPIRWRRALTGIIHANGWGWFRWFDSGDLQSRAMLHDICWVCRQTAEVQHWLPTREWEIAQSYVRAFGKPKNLTIRLSSLWIDKPAPAHLSLPTSTVVTDGSHDCPASHQNNKCGSCRACWDPNIANIAYPLK